MPLGIKWLLLHHAASFLHTEPHETRSLLMTSTVGMQLVWEPLHLRFGADRSHTDVFFDEQASHITTNNDSPPNHKVHD